MKLQGAAMVLKQQPEVSNSELVRQKCQRSGGLGGVATRPTFQTLQSMALASHAPRHARTRGVIRSIVLVPLLIMVSGLSLIQSALVDF